MTKSQPLLGKRILVTRTPSQAQDLINRVQELGGEAIPCPVIKTVIPDNSKEMDKALHNLSIYDWIIFTSVNGIRFFFQRGKEIGIHVQDQIRGKVAAVGTQTAAALHKENVKVEHIPGKFTADDLVESLKSEVTPGQKILIPQANIARKILVDELKKLGLIVDDIVAYETIPDESCKDEVRQLLENRQIHVITFTSSSTVRNFLALLDGLNWRKLLEPVMIAAIGPITAQTANQLGLKVDVIAKEYSIPGLIQELVRTGLEGLEEGGRK